MYTVETSALQGLEARACGFTRHDGKAGGAGGRLALLPEREMPSHLLSPSAAGCGKTGNSGKPTSPGLTMVV